MELEHIPRGVGPNGNLTPARRERLLAVWPAFLEDVASGELVRVARERYGITSYEQRALLVSDSHAAAEWEKAREKSADAFADEALKVARDMSNSSAGQAAASHARNLIDTLKWASRIRNPRLYGDALKMDVRIEHKLDMSTVLAEAQARLAAARAPLVIEGTARRVPSDESAGQSAADFL